MNEFTRLLSNKNAKSDLENGVHHNSNDDVDGDLAKEKSAKKNRVWQWCQQHSCSILFLVACLVVGGFLFKAHDVFSQQEDDNKKVHPAAQTKNDDVTPNSRIPLPGVEPKDVDAHNVNFPAYDRNHPPHDENNKSSSQKVPDDAYVISFSPKNSTNNTGTKNNNNNNNNSTMTAAAALAKSKKGPPAPPFSSYSLDNAFSGLADGQSCQNDFACANNACGKKFWDTNADNICCNSGFTLTVTMSDWSIAEVCGNQAVGKPCSVDRLCALGNCGPTGKCLDTAKTSPLP